MLKDSNVIAMVAVKDLDKAKQFYGEKLELDQTHENPGGVTYTCGNGRLFVYQAPSAGSGQATCATREVVGIESIVTDLKAKGIVFEHYDMPGAERDGDVLIMGDMKAAWFKDPDGNILGLSQM